MDFDNVYNDIKATLESDLVFTKTDLKCIKNNCIELFKEYINHNILSLHNGDFDKELTQYIYDNINASLTNTYNSSNRLCIKKKLKKIIKKILNNHGKKLYHIGHIKLVILEILYKTPTI